MLPMSAVGFILSTHANRVLGTSSLLLLLSLLLSLLLLLLVSDFILSTSPLSVVDTDCACGGGCGVASGGSG